MRACQALGAIVISAWRTKVGLRPMAHSPPDSRFFGRP